MQRAIARFLAVSLLLWAGGCARLPSPEQRERGAANLAAAQGWRRLDIAAPPFVLAAYLPERPPAGGAAGRSLTVYLEGDGLAWFTGTIPASNPTPVDPVGLRLALRQPGGAAAYLARPCQYTSGASRAGCAEPYWTSRRFAPEVVAATSQAITILKGSAGAATLRLVGYSGGGAVAVLVAAGRSDVRELVTVAGNLDHVKWTAGHAVGPLDGSLNPADVAARIAAVPQLHFVGALDQVMPREIAESFVARQGPGSCAAIVTVAGVGHVAGWAEHWPELLTRVPPCLPGTPE